TFAIDGYEAEVRRAGEALWLNVRRAGQGGLALRAAPLAAGDKAETVKPARNERVHIRTSGALGRFEVRIIVSDAAPSAIRTVMRCTPAAPALIPHLPRDLIPLGKDGDPLNAAGRVEAVQRGLNGGLLYFQLERPDFGNVLYFQNLTARGDYFEATGTAPDGIVGGAWPELGLAL